MKGDHREEDEYIRELEEPVRKLTSMGNLVVGLSMQFFGLFVLTCSLFFDGST